MSHEIDDRDRAVRAAFGLAFYLMEFAHRVESLWIDAHLLDENGDVHTEQALFRPAALVGHVRSLTLDLRQTNAAGGTGQDLEALRKGLDRFWRRFRQQRATVREEERVRVEPEQQWEWERDFLQRCSPLRRTNQECDHAPGREDEGHRVLTAAWRPLDRWLKEGPAQWEEGLRASYAIGLHLQQVYFPVSTVSGRGEHEDDVAEIRQINEFLRPRIVAAVDALNVYLPHLLVDARPDGIWLRDEPWSLHTFDEIYCTIKDSMSSGRKRPKHLLVHLVDGDNEQKVEFLAEGMTPKNLARALDMSPQRLADVAKKTQAIERFGVGQSGHAYGPNAIWHLAHTHITKMKCRPKFRRAWLFVLQQYGLDLATKPKARDRSNPNKSK